MKHTVLWQKILEVLYRYLLFFMMVAFLVSCTTMLFVSVLSETLHLELTGENLGAAAKLTMGNTIFLSVLFMVVDELRRKWTTERITRHIADAAKQLVQGDFHVRIKEKGWFGVDKSILEIIDCFNKMAEELSGVETLRTDFVANVSHEMKTPLAVLQNYGTLLQTPDLEEEKRIAYAKGIQDGARRLSDMMTNILRLNRLEKQQIYPKAEAYDLGEQLCECLLHYETVWEEKNIEIDTDFAEAVTVTTDKELLSLVWNNLFSNAFKFTPEGGKVSVSLEESGTDIVVQVKDTGCGISPEVGSHIFEKFYQGDTSHATQGNGLGLALVKCVVDILRAEIKVESIPGKGSTFTIRFTKEKGYGNEA